jgi:hypothetical protein
MAQMLRRRGDRAAPQVLAHADAGMELAMGFRFEGSVAQDFVRRLGAVDFVNSIVLFGASLFLSVLPFVILLSSIANHRIDTDLSRHIGLNHEGADIVSPLFRASPAHSTVALVTALLTWFIAIGAVIVLGAVGGATWDQLARRGGRARSGQEKQLPERRGSPCGSPALRS